MVLHNGKLTFLRGKAPEPDYKENDEVIFIALYPIILIFMTIPVFKMLQNLTIWKLNHV